MIGFMAGITWIETSGWHAAALLPGPVRDTWEVAKAWWTLHVSHTEVVRFWQVATGVPIAIPGGAVIVMGVLSKHVHRQLKASPAGITAENALFLADE